MNGKATGALASLQPPFRILLTSGGSGRRHRLAASLQKALQTTGVGGELICADTIRFSPGLFQFDGGHCVPPTADPGYGATMARIIDQRRINLVIPTADHDLVYWAHAKREFAARGVLVLVSDESTVARCLEKPKVNALLKKNGIPVPASPAKRRVSDDSFPLICKPIAGSGTRGVYTVNNRREWREAAGRLKNYFIQRKIEGPEFTVDVLCDLQGAPALIIPRERLAVRAGVSDVGVTVRDPAITELAAAICRLLPFVGPINMQFIGCDGQYYFIEINPRFAGGVSCSIAAVPPGGLNFVEMLMLIIAGRRPRVDVNDYRENMVMMVYEEALHLPMAELEGRDPQ